MNFSPLLGALGLLSALGCVTVNITFPKKEVEKAAQVIVDEARPAANGESAEKDASSAPEGQPPAGKDRVAAPPPSPPERAGSPEARSRFLPVSFSPLPVPLEEKKEVGDADIQIDIKSPVLIKIRASLARRFPKLLPLYEKGAIGENRDGYLEAREEAKLSLAEKRDRSALVEEENRDRKNLYQEILSENKLDKENLKKVERIFAEKWREKSRTGWWIQTAGGEWIRKPPPKDPKKKESPKEKPAGAI
jgi:uncharacterized protein YdbL (DUF1318 family)